MPGLVLENVSKWYGPVEAVPEINLEIQDKEFAILVGPSGCGKSTVLRMIAGLETPTRGRILLDNVDITARAPKDRNMAMVFQDYALYPHMSVYENMAFSLTLRKVPKAQITRAVQEAAGILGLEGLLQRRPGELSGGSASALRSAARWSGGRICSCSTSPSPTSTRRCAGACARS